MRPEGEGFVGGCPSWEIEPGYIWDIDRGYFANYFEDTVWALIANVVPKFETIKLERSWGGHYAQNMFDGNMIIGRYSDDHENLFTACGFPATVLCMLLLSAGRWLNWRWMATSKLWTCLAWVSSVFVTMPPMQKRE